MKREARIWLKIINACLIPGKEMTEISRDRVCLVYSLMIDVPINIDALVRIFMHKSRTHKMTRFSSEGLHHKFLK